jgi:hypothetical protein
MRAAAPIAPIGNADMQSADMKDLHETNIDWIFKSPAPADGIRAAIKSMPCLSNIQG